MLERLVKNCIEAERINTGLEKIPRDKRFEKVVEWLRNDRKNKRGKR